MSAKHYSGRIVSLNTGFRKFIEANMPDDTRLGDVLSEWREVNDPPLASENIQVWRIELDVCRCFIVEFLRLLIEEERQRASQTRAGETRDQFIVGRVVLRMLIGKLLAIAPFAVEFSRNQYGKLGLRSETVLRFNVAHSREMILIALTLSGPVGIDVEAIDRVVEVMEVAQSAFAPGEVLHLQNTNSTDDRLLMFFRCWTRKEAAVKADGRGLSVSLTEFSVPMRDEIGGDVLLPQHESCTCYTLRVGQIALGASYIGALASVRKNQQIIGYSLSRKVINR